METKKIDIKFVLIFTGTFVSCIMGAGFATGQELMQFFVAYGIWGLVGVLVMCLLYTFTNANFLLLGFSKDIPEGGNIFGYYIGKRLGKIMNVYAIVFIFMIFVVVIGGAGAAVNQQFGIPNVLGIILIGVCATLTVVMGLNRILSILGRVGHLLLFIILFLGIYTVANNLGNLENAAATVDSYNILKVSGNWFVAAVLYVANTLLASITIISAIGAKAPNKKTIITSAVAGSAAFSAATGILCLSLLLCISETANTLIPILALLQRIHSVLANVYIATIIVSIYSSTVPILWTLSEKVGEYAKGRTKLVTAIIGIAGIVISTFVSFDNLVNIVYTINGYVGILFLLAVIFKAVRRLFPKK